MDRIGVQTGSAVIERSESALEAIIGEIASNTEELVHLSNRLKALTNRAFGNAPSSPQKEGNSVTPDAGVLGKMHTQILQQKYHVDQLREVVGRLETLA